MSEGKLSFSGTIVSIQPRIRLTRSFNEVAHTYLGYNIFLNGRIEGNQEANFIIAIGKGAEAKFCFRKGDDIRGLAVHVENPRIEIAAYYKVSALELFEREDNERKISETSPFTGIPLTLPEYREKGGRRLFVRTYNEKCWQCIWGCSMAVEIIKDQWKPHLKKYRRETFCYGPRDCTLYVAGRKRQAPGRKPGMVYIEEEEENDIW